MSSGGWVMAYSGCFCCKQPFSYNPNKVPSIRVNGVKEPVCISCMYLVNEKRAAAGLSLHPIDPEAYNPMPVSERGE